MRVSVLFWVIAVVAGAACARAAPPAQPSVLSYHGDPARTGAFVAPGLSWSTAANIHEDHGFDGQVDGHVFAQPLYWRPVGAAHGLVIVVTESDVVDALDSVTGHLVWQRTVGIPAPASAFPCGNIDPLGITGTPVIDPSAGAVYLDAMVRQDGVPEHLVFGLRLSDGAVLPGWPINARQALRSLGLAFDPLVQQQRAALALLDGRVFVAFGGHWGDCGAYHGVVLGISTSPPRAAAGWETRGIKGGIWAQGGISSAGGALFFSTGNTEGAKAWADGEGVFRLGPDLVRSNNPRDFYAPANWKQLDDDDLDMSGVSPLPIDTADGAHRLVAFGKDGNAYLIDRDDLGGIGGQIAITRAARSVVITGPAVYRSGGRVLVAYEAPQAICPGGRESKGLAAIEVTATALAPAWCAKLDGYGSAIVTTTDGHTDPIVWVAGAEGDNRLHAYRGDTGEPLYTSPERMEGLRHFMTILAADGHFYLAGDGRVTAFTWASP